jgi:hypothetical protein
MVEIDLETSQLSLQVNRVPKENLVKKFAPYASNQPLYEGLCQTNTNQVEIVIPGCR